MDHRSSGEETREPIFRSDLEGPRPEPRYEPLRPEGGLWSVIKRWVAPLAAVGLLLAKFKGLALLLLKVKFLGTALTMLVSIGAYALLFPVWFAVGIVVLIWVHEMGHVLQLKREGIAASAPMFIPFLGAFVAMKQMPKDALAEARVGLAGPVLGTLGGLATLGLYALTGEHLFLGLAYFNFIINLFNLAPLLPLDGGRAVGAMSPLFQLLGLVVMVALFFVAPIMAFIALIGLPELWHRWKTRNTPEGRAYYDLPLRQRVAVGAVYLGLIVVLGLLTGATFVPDPATTSSSLRTILYTGKGGVGKTSVAAATALKASLAGKKVLVMSTDPAHSLADVFDTEIGPDPKEMTQGLWAQEMDHTSMIEENWSEIQGYMTTLFEWQGADTLAAEELAMLPGMDELFGLLMVRRHNQEGLYDALILDAAPTGETLKLLSLPDHMSWYVEKIFPIQRRAAKLVRPFANRARSLPPLPEDSVFAAGQRFYEAIASVEEILTDRESASVRLVLNAEKMVIAEARRAYTYLNLYDYGVDALVVNRLLPETVSDPYFARWHDAQARHMRTIEESFGPIPILTARLFDREMFGLEALGALAEDVFEDAEPLGVLFRGATHDIEKNGEGYDVVFHLPLAEKRNVDLSKKGAELLVKVGNYRRNILLPDALARLPAAGARFEGGSLRVRLKDG